LPPAEGEEEGVVPEDSSVPLAEGEEEDVGSEDSSVSVAEGEEDGVVPEDSFVSVACGWDRSLAWERERRKDIVRKHAAEVRAFCDGYDDVRPAEVQAFFAEYLAINDRLAPRLRELRLATGFARRLHGMVNPEWSFGDDDESKFIMNHDGEHLLSDDDESEVIMNHDGEHLLSDDDEL
jgi:hypothetical protein